MIIRPHAAAVVMLAALTSTVACSDEATGIDDVSITFVPPDERVVAPELSGELLGGGAFTLDRGDDVVVVNVWGSWCPPCRAEAAALQEVFEETAPDGVQFLGLNTRDTEDAALRFLDAKGITYPSLVDDGELQAAFRSSLPVAGIPTTFVIDRSGRVAARAVDEITYRELLDLVQRVVDEDG